MSSKKFKALDGIITSGELQVDGNFSVGGSLTLGQPGTTTTQAVRADRSVTGGTDLSGGGNLTANRIINHADIARTNASAGPTTLTNGGSFTSITSVASNARGHITGVTTTTYTLPTITIPTPDVFKNIANAGGTNQFSAAGNNDTIRFAGSGATSISFTAGTKTVTVNSTDTTYSVITTAEIQNTGSTVGRLISGQRFQDGLNTDRIVLGNWTFRRSATQNGIRILGNATTNTNTLTLTTENLNAARTITFPNATGTVALTSDLPTVGNGTLTLGTSGIATGSASFTANQSTNSTFTVNVPGTDLGYTASTRLLSSSTGTNVTLPQVTTSADGLMIAADKTKLNGIAAGAQVNVPTNLSTTATATTRNVDSSTGTNVTLPAANTTQAGVMTVADRNKLDGIQAGAQVNVPTNLGNIANSTVLQVTSSTGTNTNLPAAEMTKVGVVSTENQIWSGIKEFVTGARVFGNGLETTTFKIGTQSNQATISYTVNTARTYTIPDAGQNASFVMTAGNQTIGGTKTFSSTISGSINGNAATATTLQTARTIGGVSFNGSADINLPGVNTAGNQNTSGNAATATILANTRQINGVNFNGSTNITVPGNFTNETFNDNGYLAFIGTTATGNRQMHTNANVRVNPGTGVITANDVVASSDEKYKENITSLDTSQCLKTILSLRPTSYDWKESGEFDTGLIAQEVEKVIPHRVVKSGDDSLAVSYGKLVTELIGAVQAQNETINELKKEIEQLKGA